jgi:ribosome maturation factor RimP
MAFLPENVELRLREEIARRGLVLLALVQRGERNTTVVEIVVDAEKGVDLDEIAELSRWTSAMLDEVEEKLPGRYRLEVSSAGLDRPLEHLWQFRKNIGRLMKITFDDEKAGARTDTFRLLDVTDEGLSLETRRGGKGGKGGEGVTIPFDRIRKAIVEPEF